jgi:hypothetical protein
MVIGGRVKNYIKTIIVDMIGGSLITVVNESQDMSCGTTTIII